jgi:hypothetical protein
VFLVTQPAEEPAGNARAAEADGENGWRPADGTPRGVAHTAS